MQVLQALPFTLLPPNSVTAVFSVPVWQSGTICPAIATVSSTLSYSQRSGLYAIYTSSTELPAEYQTVVRRSSLAVSAMWGKKVYTSNFNKLAGL
jgi:hypothetical protein